jgi:DNA-binding GntR family transcriptional regulator
MTLEGPDAPERALAEHDQLVRAIAAGDVPGATACLEAHFSGRAQRIASALGER